MQVGGRYAAHLLIFTGHRYCAADQANRARARRRQGRQQHGLVEIADENPVEPARKPRPLRPRVPGQQSVRGGLRYTIEVGNACSRILRVGFRQPLQAAAEGAVILRLATERSGVGWRFDPTAALVDALGQHRRQSRRQFVCRMAMLLA